MEVRTPRQLHRKLFYTYMLVVVLVAAGLTWFSIKAIQMRNYQVSRENSQRIHREAVDDISDAEEISGYLHGQIYQSEIVMQDLQSFLVDDSETYIKKRLDHYAESNSLQQENIFDFVENGFSAYKHMKRVEIVSYAKRDITYCFAGDKVYSGRKDDSRLDAVLNDEIGTEKELSFRKEILSTEERLPLGCLVFVFDTTSLDHLMKNQKKTELLIRDQDGKAIWSSKEYPEEAFEEAEKEGRLEDYTGSFVEKETVGSYQIYTMLNKKLASQINFWTLGAAVGLGLLLVFTGELLVSWYLKRLNHRLVMILDGMEQVMKGNLTQRLLVNEKGDELDMISDRFNEMCRQLDLYIQKSYLAEIEQKNAEMQALQSQINPHFLYNTLEAIRMKAITNGDREVGKMLYSMAVTFRAQLKEKDVITLAQELHYCKKYLELFEFRYQNRFHAEVDCPLELLQCPIIKFVLQPLIENYFIHGIRMEASDNQVKIWVEKKEERLLIHLEDNGRGMTEKEIQEKNELLKKNVYEKQSSIGLSNVNRRVKAVYGPEYGVYIKQSQSGGVCVTLEIRYEEGTINENSDAGGR